MNVYISTITYRPRLALDGHTVVDLLHGVSIFRLAGGQGVLVLRAISAGLGMLTSEDLVIDRCHCHCSSQHGNVRDDLASNTKRSQLPPENSAVTVPGLLEL